MIQFYLYRKIAVSDSFYPRFLLKCNYSALENTVVRGRAH
jgi:hypothetical protein